MNFRSAPIRGPIIPPRHSLRAKTRSQVRRHQVEILCTEWDDEIDRSSFSTNDRLSRRGLRGVARDCGSACHLRLRSKDTVYVVHLHRWHQIAAPHNKWVFFGNFIKVEAKLKYLLLYRPRIVGNFKTNYFSHNWVFFSKTQIRNKVENKGDYFNVLHPMFTLVFIIILPFSGRCQSCRIRPSLRWSSTSTMNRMSTREYPGSRSLFK